jgi:hypothetical protein
MLVAMWIRRGIALVSLLALTGCSYTYELRAVVIDGHIAFIVDPNSDRQPDCIRSIYVETDEGVTAKPAMGDDAGLVEHGAFWWKDTAVTECPNPFPIRYGQHLEGRPFAYQNRVTAGVEAKPLVIGVIYDVTTTSSGSGYGGCRFRIRADRTIENLPPDIAPGVLGNGS